MTGSKKTNFDVAIIGGGFFGCAIALFLRRYANKVLIIEKEEDLLTRASYNNQARIHNGYHYPRSFITALRSHLNYSKFIVDFKKSIYSSYKQYYAIASTFSKTTSRQFVKFCKQVGSPIKASPAKIKSLFNNRLIEDVFETEEVVFDATILRKILKDRLSKKDIKVIYKSEVVKVDKGGDFVACQLQDGRTIHAKQVYNCTYSQINRVLMNSSLSILPLKHEFIEMALLKVPPELEDISVTVMDGPFFGFLPFPDNNCHSLWHVRYAIHANWTDSPGEEIEADLNTLSQKSNYLFMIKDAQRYLPILGQSEYLESIYETKTILAEKERSDARPILYRKDYGIKGFHIVMGGKVDNIYDIFYEIRKNREI